MTDAQNELDPAETLRTIKTRRDKILRFDGEVEDGGRVSWYVAYRGNYGWRACRGDGELMDNPTEEDVEHSFDVYEYAELLDRSETPEAVEL